MEPEFLAHRDKEGFLLGYLLDSDIPRREVVVVIIYLRSDHSYEEIILEFRKG